MLVIQFILVIGVLAFLHELGHFLIAKAFHIEIEEFGFGFPPRLAKLFTWGGTDVTLNWIPFGAFVRPKGENDPDVPGGLASASPGARLAVLFAGPIFNLLVGIALFSLVFTQSGAPDYTKVEIIAVSQPSPAYEAGLLNGDIIGSINGEEINSIEELSTLVQANLGKEITFTYFREGEPMSVQLTPRLESPPDQGPIGIGISNPIGPVSLAQAIPFGFLVTYEQAKQLVLLPGNLIKGQVNPEEARILGPKGIFDVYKSAYDKDVAAGQTSTNNSAGGINVLWITAVISVAFGLTNLLPLPALDGGRILFVLPEILFRKRVPAKYENMVHFIGFTALIVLLFFITFQDIFNPVQIP